MKFVLPLFLMSFAAHSACDYKISENVTRTPAERNQILCKVNFNCAERAMKQNPEESEIESYLSFSRAHQCQDELRFATLFAEGDELVAGNSATDLPKIPDSQERIPANSQE